MYRVFLPARLLCIPTLSPHPNPCFPLLLATSRILGTLAHSTSRHHSSLHQSFHQSPSLCRHHCVAIIVSFHQSPVAIIVSFHKSPSLCALARGGRDNPLIYQWRLVECASSLCHHCVHWLGGGGRLLSAFLFNFTP